MVKFEDVTSLQDTLIDNGGKILRKGTLVLTFINAREFDKLMLAENPPADREEQLRVITEDLEEFTETVNNAGMFEYFEPKMWFAGEHYGRAIVAAWWLQEYPEGFQPGIEENITKVLKRGGKLFQEEFFFVLPELRRLLD